MALETRHLSVGIDRPAAEVYAYASQPANLPEWASGLGGKIEQVDGEWIADSPMGRIAVALAPDNEFGVLDHDVRMPTGETFYNPMRVIPDGEGSEVIFTLRRLDGVSSEDFERDAETITGDLTALKQVLEQ